MSEYGLTAEQLTKKYRGKYVKEIHTYDHTIKQWVYRVNGVSKTIRENYNLPEDCIIE